MDNEILVSISCTTYNHEDYIERCLSSLVSQITNFKYEILIHDDCSTDKTVEIVENFVKRYPDLIKPIYQKENQWSKGLSITYTYQYPRALGKYIAICEGDDYWIDPLKLQKQVNFMEENEDFILCGTNGIMLYDNKNHMSRLFNIIDETKELLLSDVISQWKMPTASLLFRKELIDKLKTFKQKVYSGDQKLIMSAAHNGRIMYFDDVSVVYYRHFTESSVSYRLSKVKNVALEYADKMLVLYNAFNDYSKKQHEAELKPVIKYWKSIKTIQEDKDKYGLLSYFIHPLYVITYIIPSYIFRRKCSKFDKAYNSYRNTLLAKKIFF